VKKLMIVASLWASTGCFHIKYTNSAPPASQANEEKWHHNFVFGFIENEGVDLTKECPNGTWSVVEHQNSVVDAAIFWGANTLGWVVAVGGLVNWVWQPSHTKVTCAVAGAGAPLSAPPPQ
jgi:hypothetical protein